MTYLWAFLTGLLASILATWLIQAIASRMFWSAILLDATAGSCGIVAYQLWAKNDHDWKVLAAELCGSVLGTAVGMR